MRPFELSQVLGRDGLTHWPSLRDGLLFDRAQFQTDPLPAIPTDCAGAVAVLNSGRCAPDGQASACRLAPLLRRCASGATAMTNGIARRPGSAGAPPVTA